MMGTLGTADTAQDAAQRTTRESDALLLSRTALGDDRAFAALYEAHRRPLHRLAYGVLLDANDARDAVQEAFLQLHRAAATWEPNAAVGTWLYRVVLNHSLSIKARLRRWARPAFGHSRSTIAATTASPESAASNRQSVPIVERSLLSLSPKQRAVACLFLEAELAPADIAPLVSLTPNATRVTLHRALSQIRQDLAAAGIDAPPTPDEILLTTEED